MRSKMTQKKLIKRIARQVGKLTAKKNAAYGDSARVSAEMLKILYPNGIELGQYRDMMLVSRILDKLCRIANRKEAFGESPYRDIAGYGVIGSTMDEE